MRILVVEDEKKIAGFIRNGLKEEGYAVDVASDGETGCAMASAGDYDLLVLDVMLPKRDGVSVCRKLRSEKRPVPILMLTAKGEVEDKVTGLDAGADDYLVKPFAFEELLARVRALLRKTGGIAATLLKVRDLTLDLLTRRVTRSGREVLLTTREFALLEFLMRRAGKLVTRTMILEHVWDVHSDTGTNVIDVHMAHLRRKIDAGAGQPLLTTVRGRGYMLKT